MKKLLKKSILFIMLLLTCIVFTGCNNTDNYDDSDITTLKVTVDKNLINGSNSSERASYDLNNLNLYFNGTLFQGHNLDTEGNFIFTNVMYTEKAYEMSNPATMTTILITVGTDTKLYNIVCENIKELPTSLFISLKNKLVKMVNNGNKQVFIQSVNGETDGYVDADEITRVKIEKYENNNLKAKVTFYNGFNQSKKIEYDSWKISALNEDLDVLQSWTKSSNDNASLNLNLDEIVSGNDIYYIVSLTSLGKNAARSHNLDNTIVKIDNIRLKDKDQVDTGVLEAGMWDYRTR